MMTTEQDPENLRSTYGETCASYHAVDDFRMKLLGLLPVATGTGVFLLLSSNADLLGGGGPAQQEQTLEAVLSVIGGIGFAFTLGLFAYELFGIKRCHYLIETGQRLEFQLGVRGQFRSRPSRLLGIVIEPGASALIYPASMAAWLFLAVAYRDDAWRLAVPAVVFFLGLISTVAIARGIEWAAERAFRAEVWDLLIAELESKGEGPEKWEDLAGVLARAVHADQSRVQKAIDAIFTGKLASGKKGVVTIRT
jgi:hypothetical protein